MDIESVGAGAGGGALSAILAWFGIKQRLDRQDKDIEKIQEGTIWRSTCNATHEGLNDRMERMERKIDILVERRGEKR